MSLGPSAAPVRVPALREGIGRFGGFMEPRPAGMSARSGLGLPGPPGPSPPPRRAAPRATPGLAIQSSSGSDLWSRPAPRRPDPPQKVTSPPWGVGSSGLSPAVPGTRPAAPPHPPARAHGTILALSCRLHLGFSVASGYAFFPGRSPKHSSSSQRARLPLFPESSLGVGIQALSSAPVRAWV